MVITKKGNVIIDTSFDWNAQQHKTILKNIDKGNIKYIILTHAHSDHIGGISLWKEVDTQIIQQKEAVEFMNWKARMMGKGNYSATIPATILFNDKYVFELGGVRFELYHTPGETYDHITIWIPDYKIAFSGDNFYRYLFPNLYTLRGTKPRWALDYVNSLNKIIELKPEILVPGHGMPVYSNELITGLLTKYRDIISYIHDETVKGIVEGKNKYSLMREITLPPNLDFPENFGRIDWSVRGIYEGYMGFFDGEVTDLFPVPVSEIYPEMVKLAGGIDVIVNKVKVLIDKDKLIEGLHLINMALSENSNHRTTLEIKLMILEKLFKKHQNPFMQVYINKEISEIKDRLTKK